MFAHFILLLSISITATTIVNLQILNPKPQFESLVFKKMSYQIAEESLKPSETLQLKSLISTLDSRFLTDATLGILQPQKVFELKLFKNSQQLNNAETDFFTIPIDRQNLFNTQLAKQIYFELAQKIKDLNLVGGYFQVLTQKKSNDFIVMSCEPPSLKKISSMRKQIRRVLYLQMCSPVEKSLASHIKTNQVDRFLETNKKINFAVLNLNSWQTYEKWHGDLWSNPGKYKLNAGVTSLTINPKTQVKQAQAAIQVIESARGIAHL